MDLSNLKSTVLFSPNYEMQKKKTWLDFRTANLCMLSLFDVLPTLARLSDCAEDWQSVKQILDKIFSWTGEKYLC